MILNLGLGIIFLGSTTALWYFVSKRIPELVAIPDEVITKRLEEDSARVRVFLLRFKSFYTEGRIKDFFWSIFANTLHRVHIILLRADNTIVSLLKRVRGNGGSRGAATGITVGGAELQKSSKIHEIRTRKNDSANDSQAV